MQVVGVTNICGARERIGGDSELANGVEDARILKRVQYLSS